MRQLRFSISYSIESSYGLNTYLMKECLILLFRLNLTAFISALDLAFEYFHLIQNEIVHER